ncbi:MAG: hypothetical protein IJA60_08375 [Clostridia bacterium]|nr:hypothetical protein [Clostridia bacterium]
MRKSLMLLTLSALLFFSSCSGEEAVLKPGEVITQGATPSPEQPGKIAIITEGKRITITTLEEWNRFNYDGNFTDNCKNFLRMFIEGYSEFAEFKNMKISDWELIRDPDVYGNDLAFNFTVIESTLDTLPPGIYKTTVKDAVDCYMTFEKDAPNTFTKEIASESEAVATVKKWISSFYSWYMPEYGKASNVLPCINYIIAEYGDNDIITIENFKKHLNEKMGIDASNEDLKNYIVNINGSDCLRIIPIGGNTDFAIIGETTQDDVTTVTVQYFADCNRFILSDTVEYYISADKKLLGCNVTNFADYEPYGVNSAF